MRVIFQKLFSLVLDGLESITIALSVWLVLYLFIVQPTEVKGSSMEPNFHDNDRVYAEKISYRLDEPKRGDVIALHAPPQAQCAEGTGCDFFKRIIGLPGETIAVDNGHFIINGEELDEPYLPARTHTASGPFIKDRIVTLEKNEYFVAGDNREHSSDSRFWGPITKDEIVGRAVIRWYSTSDKLGVISRPQYALTR